MAMNVTFAAVATVAIAMLITPAAGTRAAAQGSRITMQGQAENFDTAAIRDSLGRPCLDVEAAARARLVDPKMLDHVVSIKSKCGRHLKLNVCYLNSGNCKLINLQPYQRVDTILGTLRGVSFFKYTVVLSR